MPLQLVQLSLDAVAVCRCGSQDAAGAEEATAELRSYQQRALDQIKSGGNYILVAPTGAHLTCIPQKHAVNLTFLPAAYCTWLPIADRKLLLPVKTFRQHT